MVVVGIDAHERTHTVVAVDETGRQLGVRVTQSTSTAAHLDLVRWAAKFGPGRVRAVEDCRHLSRRLEADLLAAGEQIVRVPPRLMAHMPGMRRHRLSRTGNRQLNCVIQGIAVTQIRCPPAQACRKARIAAGDTKTEALRALKRRLSDVIYHALLADSTTRAAQPGSLT